MLAAALFASTAAALFPMFSDSSKTRKQGDIRKLCQDVIRGKLDEYRYGKGVNPAWAATPGAFAANVAGDFQNDGLGDKPQLNNLTIPSRSSTQVSIDAAGNGTPLATNGFTYAKVRYNRYFPASCQGTSFALRVNTLTSTVADRALGMRECIGTGVAWQDVPSPTVTGTRQTIAPLCNVAAPSSNDIDRRIATEIPGFKLYVKLELATPWSSAPWTTPANANKALQFDPLCPDSGVWPLTPPAMVGNFYDFNGSSEGIRVTVTGVMDTASANPALVNFAGMPDGMLDNFVCSVQSTVYPEAFPVRYYLSNDGRIYPVQGGGTNGSSTATGWVLASLYSQSASFRSSSITSFAVHPRNAAVYVLRPGTLTRYGNCGGAVLDCSTDATANNGVSDTGVSGYADVQEFQVNPAIRSIAVDFTNNRVYGMMGDRSSVLQLTINCLNADPNCGKASGGPVVNIAYQSLVPGQFPVPNRVVASGAQAGMSASGRLSGFFISPNGDDAFVSDFSSSISLGHTGYASGVYRATDTGLLWPIARLPVAAVSFSK